MNELPATLDQAIASEPVWLLAWLTLLVGTHFLSVFFIPWRDEQGWHVRWEPFAIVGSFFVAGALMSALYGQFGYVRLLGLAHIVGWAPIYGWLAYRRKAVGFTTLWGRYVHLYLLVAGISLAVDAVDTVRFLMGEDASLYLRWS